ncbi:MAG: hypothetical protein AB7U76_24390 [Pirellulales bacterium]
MRSLESIKAANKRDNSGYHAPQNYEDTVAEHAPDAALRMMAKALADHPGPMDHDVHVRPDDVPSNPARAALSRA